MNTNDSNLINAVCDDFEAAWNAAISTTPHGEFPRIEDYLGRVNENCREQILVELIKIDCEHHLKISPDVSSANYSGFGKKATDLASQVLNRLRDAPTITDQPVLGESATATLVSEKMIDQFELIRMIGKGGMGAVWLAKQREPNREVALKVISSGFISKEARARFDAERQALAMLDHPYIAKVYDGGTTQDGSPYFVMELVNGVPLTQHSDQKKLDVRQRLTLMVDACEAIRHAHQRGIIHRDLKPLNVLVAETDNGPVPKVIDFGLAKSINRTQKLTEQTLDTEFGRVLGTLKYMSPEQAELDSQDIDTRTDVYSLGVMLYEMLTGSTPLDADTLKGNSLLETLRIIRESEPLRPSHLLSSSSHALASEIGEDRQIVPTRLRQILKGELDWIVMKAIEKDRDRRYESVAELSNDIQRYLNGDAVLAKPPTLKYRISKSIAKNKTLFAVGAASAFLLLLAAGVATWFAFWAMDEAKLAKEEGSRADREKQTAVEMAEKAQASAEEAKESATIANASAKRSSDMLGVFIGAFRSPDPEAGGTKDMSAADVLSVAAEQVDDVLADDSEAQIKLLSAIAKSFAGLGHYEDAVEISDQVYELSKSHYGLNAVPTLEALDSFASHLNLAGKHAEAIPLYKFAIQAADNEHGANSMISMKLQGDLGACWIAAGRPEEAIGIYEPILESKRLLFDEDSEEIASSKHNLAISYSRVGKHELSLKLHREVLKSYQIVHSDSHPDIANSMASIAIQLEMLGKYDDALEMKKEVLRLQQENLRENHPAIAITLNNLAHAYASLKRWEDAIATGNKAVETMKLAYPENHPNTLKAINSLARFYRDSGDIDKAIPHYLEALQIRTDTLGPEHPSTIGSYKGIGLCYKRFKQYDKAYEYYLKGLELAEIAYRPNHPELAYIWANLGYAYRDGGRLSDSVDAFKKCIAIRKIELGAQHKETRKTLDQLADIHLRMVNGNEAMLVLEELLEIQTSIPELDASQFAETYRMLHLAHGCQQNTPELEEATKAWITSLKNEKTLRQNTLFQANASLAAALVDQGRFQPAREVTETAMSITSDDRTSSARLKNVKALCLAEDGELEQAVVLAKESLADLDIEFLESCRPCIYVYAPNAFRRSIKVLELADDKEGAIQLQAKLEELESWIEESIAAIK